MPSIVSENQVRQITARATPPTPAWHCREDTAGRGRSLLPEQDEAFPSPTLSFCIHTWGCTLPFDDECPQRGLEGLSCLIWAAISERSRKMPRIRSSMRRMFSFATRRSPYRHIHASSAMKAGDGRVT